MIRAVRSAPWAVRLLPALLLGACAYTPLGALVSLRGVDPLQADGAALRVAVVAPPDLALARRPRLVLATLVEGRPRDETRLDLSAERPGPDAPDTPHAEGSRTTVFRLPPEEATRLAAFQDNIRRLRAAGIHGTVEVTADIAPCRAGPADTGVLDVYLKAATQTDYVRVLRNVPASELQTAGPSRTTPADCSNSPSAD